MPSPNPPRIAVLLPVGRSSKQSRFSARCAFTEANFIDGKWIVPQRVRVRHFCFGEISSCHVRAWRHSLRLLLIPLLRCSIATPPIPLFASLARSCRTSAACSASRAMTKRCRNSAWRSPLESRFAGKPNPAGYTPRKPQILVHFRWFFRHWITTSAARNGVASQLSYWKASPWAGDL